VVEANYICVLHNTYLRLEVISEVRLEMLELNLHTTRNYLRVIVDHSQRSVRRFWCTQTKM
jgi:hypothetical protein